MADLPPPFTAVRDGVRLAVRVTPRAKRSEIVGLVEAGDGRSALGVRLASPPVEGAANLALVDFLARELGLPKKAVRLAGGATSRLKIVVLSCAASDVAALLGRQ